MSRHPPEQRVKSERIDAGEQHNEDFDERFTRNAAERFPLATRGTQAWSRLVRFTLGPLLKQNEPTSRDGERKP